MDAELNQRIKYELMSLKRVRSEYMSQLSSLNDYKGSLLRFGKRKSGKPFYYIKRSGTDTYRYVSKPNLPIVEQVRKVRFLEEAIRRIDHNIALLESIPKGYIPCAASAINDSLPVLYRCDVPPVSELYQHKAAEWKADRLEFQKRFPENYPQHKTQRTSDGVMVKTISELVLYERFKSAGLAVIYELPIPMKDFGPPLYPDFVILSPIDMETEIIVEYVGRMDRYDYREDFAKRTGRYIASGYVPGVNLFFVFSDNNGNIDSMQITKVIEDIMGSCSAGMA